MYTRYVHIIPHMVSYSRGWRRPYDKVSDEETSQYDYQDQSQKNENLGSRSHLIV